MLVFVALLAGAVSGCGGGNDGAGVEDPGGLESAAARTPPVVPPAPPSSRKAASRWSTADWGDSMSANSAGVLVKPDGGEVRGWGDRAVRRYVTALFARMQYDFLTGDMASACEHVHPSLPSSSLTGVGGNGSCETTLSAYARKLENRDFQPSPLRFLWVRTYPGVAGIWVEDTHGERFRVPFVQEGDSGWLLQLTELLPLDALAMPLRARQTAS